MKEFDMATTIGQRWEVYDYEKVKGRVPMEGEMATLKETPDYPESVIQLIGDGGKTVEALYAGWKNGAGAPYRTEEAQARIDAKNLASLAALAAGKQDKLIRTVAADDSAAGAAADTGGDLSIPIPVTTAAPAASNAQTAARTRPLRAQLKTLIDNIAHLFANKAERGHDHPAGDGAAEYGPYRIDGPFYGADDFGGVFMNGYIDFKQVGGSMLSYHFLFEYMGRYGGSSSLLAFNNEENYYELAELSSNGDANPFWWDADGGRSLEIVKGGMIAPWDGVFYGAPNGSCRLIGPRTVPPTPFGSGGSAATCKLTWHPYVPGVSWGGVSLWVSTPRQRSPVQAVVGGGLIIDNNNIF
jgi:hypothetical protein